MDLITETEKALEKYAEINRSITKEELEQLSEEELKEYIELCNRIEAKFEKILNNNHNKTE